MKKTFLIFIVALFSIACQQTNETTKNTSVKPSPSVPNSPNTTPNQNVAVSSNVAPNQNVATSPLPNVATNQKASTNSTPVQDDPMNPKAKYFDGKGVVTKINKEQGSVELDHEEIKGLMPKMIMEFFVKKTSQLDSLKLGDKVEFILEDKGGAEIITEIKKIGQ